MTTRELLPAQERAIAKLRELKVGALFMQPGTGKTRTVMELVRSVPEVDLVLWLAPCRSVDPAIPGTGVVDEVAKWGGLEQVEFMGIESLSSSDRLYLHALHLLNQARCPLIVVDESLKIKNAKALRTMRIMELGRLCQYKLILNGTPVSRSLVDVWAQMEFLSPCILNMGQAEFVNTFCEWTKITARFGSTRTFSKQFITKYHNIDYLYSLIGEYVFEADLELDIHRQHHDLEYAIDADSKAAYSHLKEEYLDNEKLQFLNNNIFLELTQKMQHLYCCTDAKFQLLHKLFAIIPEEETIIACKFVRSRELCARAFPKATVLSLQADSMSLNLQHCSNLVFWDKTWDWALVDQMMHRIWRTGQQRDCRFYHLHGDVGLEGMMRKNNEKKEDTLKYLKVKTLREEL